MMRTLVFSAVFVLPVLVLDACSFLTSTDGLGGPTLKGDSSPLGTGDDGTTGNSDAGNAASSAYRSAVLADTPAAYYRFEDVSGVECVDEISGSRFTCIYSPNALSRGEPGIASSLGVKLDEKGSVSVAAPSLDFAQPFTLELWVEVDAPTASLGLVAAMKQLTLTTRIGFALFLSADQAAVRTEMWNGPFQSYTLAAGPAAANTWHHIVVGHDASNVDFAYVDGVESEHGRSSDPAGNGSVVLPLLFGGFAGRIDEIAWYDHPLTPVRILTHYALR
jgi:hypothetical protein